VTGVGGRAAKKTIKPARLWPHRKEGGRPGKGQKNKAACSPTPKVKRGQGAKKGEALRLGNVSLAKLGIPAREKWRLKKPEDQPNKGGRCELKGTYHLSTQMGQPHERMENGDAKWLGEETFT